MKDKCLHVASNPGDGMRAKIAEVAITAISQNPRMMRVTSGVSCHGDFADVLAGDIVG